MGATLTSSLLFGNTSNIQGNCNVNIGSVAVDGAPLAGCPTVDFDNDARPIGALCDVGADER